MMLMCKSLWSKKLRAGMACDVGRKRRGKVNQDAVGNVLPNFFIRRPPLLVLADGMGGHEGGQIASQLIIKTFIKKYRRVRRFYDPRSILERLTIAAHHAVLIRARKNPQLSSMGSTVAAVLFIENRLFVCNVGDSRVYVINKKEIHQISTDHSWVEAQKEGRRIILKSILRK